MARPVLFVIAGVMPAIEMIPIGTVDDWVNAGPPQGYSHFNNSATFTTDHVNPDGSINTRMASFCEGNRPLVAMPGFRQ